jgi:hypothetical protein
LPGNKRWSGAEQQQIPTTTTGPSTGGAGIITSHGCLGQPDISRNINEFTEVNPIVDYVIHWNR